MPPQIVPETAHPEPPKMTSAGSDSNYGFAQPRGHMSSFAVPTEDPFSRRTLTKKPLNPGSCSSAMNLLALGSLGSVQSDLNSDSRASALNLLTELRDQDSQRGGTRRELASSIAVPTADPSSRGTSTEKRPLNPGSCSSAMNLLLYGTVQGEEGSRRGGASSSSSVVSDASRMLRAIRGNVSNSSLFSASANGLALLLGDVTAPRRGGNRNDERVCRRGQGQASYNNRNADWGFYE